MKELVKEFKKWLFQWFVIFIFWWLIITLWLAIELEVWIDNNAWYVQKMFFTTNWSVQNWNDLKVIFDWESWSISMSGNLKIVEWAFKDKTILWEDIDNLQITTSKIWDWQITNSIFADNSINSDKILDWTIQSAKIWDWQVTNVKLIKNQAYTFNKFIDNQDSMRYINSDVTSNLYTLSWNNLDFNLFQTDKLTIGGYIWTAALWVWWKILTSNTITWHNNTVWWKPNILWTITEKWRCKYDWSKIQCVDSLGD